MSFPPELKDYARLDGAVVVPARVAGDLMRLLTLGVTEGRRRGIPVNTEMMVVLDAIQSAAIAEDSRSGSVVGTMVGDPVSLEMTDEPLVTSGQAALRLGCTARAITKAIACGRLLGRKVGNQWLIAEHDLETYRYGRPANGSHSNHTNSADWERG
jgi:excisionase family DNA binding protein